MVEVGSLLRRGEVRAHPARRARLGPAAGRCPCLLAWLACAGRSCRLRLHIVAAVLLVVPIAPLVARVVFQPIADASVLVLLIVSLALHFLLSGLGLLFFGPEGSRTQPLASGTLPLGDGFTVSGQVILMVASAIVLSGLFFLVFERTVAGKALRATAVNRVGARLVGIRPARTALLAYGCASLLAGLIGVLIAPVTTMYYDSGFIIGLKAFVAAIIGGLVSYPLTADRRARGGRGRELRLVLERGAEGRDRVQPADPGADAALVPGAACRGRETRRSTQCTRSGARIAARRSPGRGVRAGAARVLGNFSVSLMNDIGIGALVALGLVLLTGVGGATSFGQAAFVGIAAYAHGLAHDRAGPFALARAACSRCCSPACRRWRSGC